jgi:hypothetical protein
MSEILVASDAIRAYGDANAIMAADVVVAGATNQAATIAAAIPIFGLIGQDFLANLTSVVELAHVYGMSAVAAYEGAALYDTTEAASVTDFGTISREI